MPSTMTTPALLQPRAAPVHPCSPDLGALDTRFEDAHPVTVEEVGRPGQGLVGHLSPDIARRLRAAVRDALAEIGEEIGC